MPAINNKDRDCLKETGDWTIWDTIIIRYYYVLVAIILAMVFAFFFWMESEYDLFLLNLYENEETGTWID